MHDPRDAIASIRQCSDAFLAHHEHMRLVIHGQECGMGELVSSPNPIAQPAGWKTLLEMGPNEVTISPECLSSGPNCRKPRIRLPLGISGAAVAMSALSPDGKLREFSIERRGTS